MEHTWRTLLQYNIIVRIVWSSGESSSEKNCCWWLTVRQPVRKSSLQPITSRLNWPISFNGPNLKHHRRTTTFHFTLKMTSAQVVETSVTNNSSSQNYSHPDDHTIRTTDTPGFKPFTKYNIINSTGSYLFRRQKLHSTRNLISVNHQICDGKFNLGVVRRGYPGRLVNFSLASQEL